MFENYRFTPVIETVSLLQAEISEMESGKLHFCIIHRFRMPGSDCMPGEEILAIFLLYRGREYQLRLSPALLIIADYLLRNGRYAQTATQISTGIHAGGFYAEHGKNGRRQRIQRIPRSAIRVYIKRLKLALEMAFGEANLCLDPKNVLLSEESVSNHVLYLWKAIPGVVHLDSTAANAQPIFGGGRKSGGESVPDFDAR
jgi:hypothetical protein